jgi:hypothetical protein
MARILTKNDVLARRKWLQGLPQRFENQHACGSTLAVDIGTEE